jgi:hypothetical protein
MAGRDARVRPRPAALDERPDGGTWPTRPMVRCQAPLNRGGTPGERIIRACPVPFGGAS